MRLLGIVLAGIVWGNFIEYVFHRWVMHKSVISHQLSVFSHIWARHMDHHRKALEGRGHEDSLILNWPVAGLWTAHALLALAIFPIYLGIILSLVWLCYLTILEAVHRWQHARAETNLVGAIHESPLPFLVRWHMSHHEMPRRRFNIFLPLCDWLFGTS